MSAEHADHAGSIGAYAKGKNAEKVVESHHHLMPVKTYMQVFGALLVLTAITYLVSYMDLGAAALPVALVVAFVKAGLVVGYFMHLKFDTRFHSFVFFATLLFVAIFFIITFFDIKTRALMNPVWDNQVAAGDLDLQTPKPTVQDIPADELEDRRKNPHVPGEGAHH